MIAIAIGIVMQLGLAAWLSLRAFRGRSGKTLYLCLAGALLMCAFLSITLLFYNYSFIKGANLIEQREYSKAIAPLKSALAVRKALHGLNPVFDKRIMGIPMFFSSDTDVLMKLAGAYAGLKDYRNAIREYEKVIARDRTNFYATASIAEAYFQMREFETAKTYYQRIKEIRPTVKGADYYYLMGKAYMVTLDWEKAEWYFDKALELGCGNPLLKTSLAFVMKQRNCASGAQVGLRQGNSK